jgi:hypothetical protein
LFELKLGIPLTQFFAELLRSEVLVMSKEEILADGSNFVPLLFESAGHKLIAAFTSFSRTVTQNERAEYCVSIRGSEFFKRVPAGYGILLNPGFSVALVILPGSVRDIAEGVLPESVFGEP